MKKIATLCCTLLLTASFTAPVLAANPVKNDMKAMGKSMRAASEAEDAASMKAEAASSSTFVAGWRPFIGWVCGMGCAWNWIGLPVAKFGLAVYGHPLALEPADLSEMMPLLLGMLGLGGLRTFEKTRRVAR